MDKNRLLEYLRSSDFSDIPLILRQLSRFDDPEDIKVTSDILMSRFSEENSISFFRIFADPILKSESYKVDTSIIEIQNNLESVLYTWFPITSFWFELVKNILLETNPANVRTTSNSGDSYFEGWVSSWLNLLLIRKKLKRTPKKELPEDRNLLRGLLVDLAVIRFLYGYSPELWGLTEGLDEITQIECQTTDFQTCTDKIFNIPWTREPIFLKDSLSRIFKEHSLFYRGGLPIFSSLKLMIARISRSITEENILKTDSIKMNFFCKLPLLWKCLYFPDISPPSPMQVHERIGIGQYNPRGIARLGNIFR